MSYTQKDTFRASESKKTEETYQQAIDTKSSKNKENFRTKVCRYVNCRNKDLTGDRKCTYAHSSRELIVKYCHHGNNCKNGDCTYFHPSNDPVKYYERMVELSRKTFDRDRRYTENNRERPFENALSRGKSCDLSENVPPRGKFYNLSEKIITRKVPLQKIHEDKEGFSSPKKKIQLKKAEKVLSEQKDQRALLGQSENNRFDILTDENEEKREQSQAIQEARESHKNLPKTKKAPITCLTPLAPGIKWGDVEDD